MDPRNLAVGDIVGVVRIPGVVFDEDRSLGICCVVKKNKVRIVLARESDGHVFNFSARYGELILGGGKLSYDVYVETVQEQARRVEQAADRKQQRRDQLQADREAKQHRIDQIMMEIQTSAAQQNVTALREAMSRLNQLQPA